MPHSFQQRHAQWTRIVKVRLVMSLLPLFIILVMICTEEFQLYKHQTMEINTHITYIYEEKHVYYFKIFVTIFVVIQLCTSNGEANHLNSA
jgi:hypothetical protein